MRIVTSAFNLISILAVWGFMAYFGFPKGTPWFLKPIGIVWAVMPFFSLNLVARRKWTGFRARATLLAGAGLLCSMTIQALNTMFIIDPKPHSSAMFFVLPFFSYVLLGFFLLAAWIFEQKSQDDD